MNNTQLACPSCGAAIPVHTGYLSWCECGWNLEPRRIEPDKGTVTRIKLKLGDRMARDLFTTLANSRSLVPSFNLSKVLAIALATMVHLTTIFFVVLGIGLIIGYWPNVLAVIGGAMALAIAWVLHPRFGKKPETILTREDFPALYHLVDNLAATLGLRPIGGIVLTTSFNAAFAQVGLRRRSYIHIGLPLFFLLTSEERVALLGHEVAHGVNGDSTRGLFIGSAVTTLETWYSLLMPVEIFSSESGMPGLLMAPMNLLLAGLAQIAYGGAYLLLLLTMRNSQRAEYLADYLATTVSGTDAMLTLLDKVHYDETYAYALQRTALNHDAGTVYDQLSRLVASTPQREIERMKRIGQLDGSRIDASHPPTTYRRQLLALRPVPHPLIDISQEQNEAINRELERCYTEAHHRALDEYRSQIYH